MSFELCTLIYISKLFKIKIQFLLTMNYCTKIAWLKVILKIVLVNKERSIREFIQEFVINVILNGFKARNMFKWTRLLPSYSKLIICL